MAQEDAVRKDETAASLEDAEKRAEKAKEEEANRLAVDKAREHMKAVLDGGGLRLDEDKISVEDAFQKVQKEMKEKFSNRLNTKEQDQDLSTLMQGKRIHETFEVAPGGFAVKFQNLDSDESAFISQITLLNGSGLRSGTEDVPRYDESMRLELTLALVTVAVNKTIFPPITLDDLYEADDKGEEEAKVATIGEKVKQIHKRLGMVRKALTVSAIYPTVITALGVWMEYQRDLVSPTRIGNFSTAPSERS